MNNSFFDNLKASAGVVLPPLSGGSNSLRNVKTNLSPSTAAPFRVNWNAMNNGLDKAVRVNPSGATRIRPMLAGSKNIGVPLAEVEEVQDIVDETPSKRLWRLDGKNANISRYESLLDDVKKQISASNSFEDTAKILKKYAKDWDMNMYILGTDEGRERGFYDWSPASMFAEEADAYDNRDSQNAEEWPKDYTNDEWKAYLIDTIDHSLTTSAKGTINPRRVRFV